MVELRLWTAKARRERVPARLRNPAQSQSECGTRGRVSLPWARICSSGPSLFIGRSVRSRNRGLVGDGRTAAPDFGGQRGRGFKFGRARTLQRVDHNGLRGMIRRRVGPAGDGHGAIAGVVIGSIPFMLGAMVGGQFLFTQLLVEQREVV